MQISTFIIFGGAGFIGAHFSRFLLDNNLVDRVLIADLKDTCEKRFETMLANYIENDRIEFIKCDVRKEVWSTLGNRENVIGIANLAAIHREPGHEPYEYYETNLSGASNVCDYADKISCKNIIFTSSIAPYGPTEEPKSENDLPVPVTPYGCSKLVAEKVHEAWANENSEKRLTIVRPGVVYGQGEQGNVTRMIKAINRGYFVFMGNKQTRKAGIYVKELCNAIWWSTKLHNRDHILLINMTLSPGPSIEEYVSATLKLISKKRLIMNIPFFAIYPLSFVINFCSMLLRVKQPINPVRIQKLVKSNNILPTFLEINNYPWNYDLLSSLEDWKRDCQDDWS